MKKIVILLLACVISLCTQQPKPVVSCNLSGSNWLAIQEQPCKFAPVLVVPSYTRLFILSGYKDVWLIDKYFQVHTMHAQRSGTELELQIRMLDTLNLIICVKFYLELNCSQTTWFNHVKWEVGISWICKLLLHILIP